MKRDDIDMHAVSSAHEDVHALLIEWARWCAPGGGGAACAPMFRHYRPYLHPESQQAQITIDTVRALKTQRAFVRLPEANRHALSWAYVYPFVHIGKACRLLAVNQEGLHALIGNARKMMRNLLTNADR